MNTDVTTLVHSPLTHGAPRNEAVATSRVQRQFPLYAFIALCVASALTGRLSYLAYPFSSDGAMYIYMGKLVASGGRVGVDLIDVKFPTVGLMTSAAWRAFGANWGAYVVLQTVLALLSAILLGRGVGRVVGSHARLPTVLFALVYLNLAPVIFGGFQLETILAFFAVLGACSAIAALREPDHRDAFVVGLAGATAMLIKPSGASVIAAFVLAMLVTHRRSPRLLATMIAATVAGALLPATVAVAYLSVADLWSVLPEMGRMVGRYANQSAWSASDALKPVIVLLIGSFPLLVRGVIFRRPADREAAAHASLWLFACTWLAIELAGVVAQRRMYAYHFLAVAPPFALMFGLLPRRDRLGPLVASLVPAMLLSFVGVVSMLRVDHLPAQRLPVGEYLLAHVQPGETVWQDEWMRLAIETDLTPGARLPSTYLWSIDDEAPRYFGDTVLQDFERQRPAYVVLPNEYERHVEFRLAHLKEFEQFPVRRDNARRAWMSIRDYVQQHYVAEATLDGQTIYRRQG